MIFQNNRLTQDSPILPEIWNSFNDSTKKIDVLIIPTNDEFDNYSVLKKDLRSNGLLPNGRSLIATVTLQDIVEKILPYSKFYQLLWDENGNETNQMKWLKDNLALKNCDANIVQRSEPNIVHRLHLNRKAFI